MEPICDAKALMKIVMVGALVVSLLAQKANSQARDLRFTSDQNQLIRVLTSNASDFDKAKACQRLAEIGDARAIESLEKLLPDEQLSNYARHALEGIADPQVLAALRKSLGQLEGDLLEGVIGSIGRRRDTEAIDALARFLQNADECTANAAARAMAQIGNEQAAERLMTALANASFGNRDALASACLACAQRLVQTGDRAIALAMLDKLQSGGFGPQIKSAAVYDSILASGDQTMPMLIRQLRSSEYSMFAVALQAALRLDGDVADELANELDVLSDERRAMVLEAIGRMKINKVPAQVIRFVRDGSSAVRVAALGVLAQPGSTEQMDILFAAAVDNDPAVATAARESIALADSSLSEKRIVAMLGRKDPIEVAVALELSSRLRLEQAATKILELLQSREFDLRVAAIRALGSTCSVDQLATLVTMSIDDTKPDELAAAREALNIACVRLPQDDCTETIQSVAKKASNAGRDYLLERIANVGGERALQVLATAARSSDVALQETSTRLLGEWLSADAASTLLDLSKTLTDGRLQTRALRGYIRIARQLDMPLNERMNVCRNALLVSNRADERKLVLEVLRQYSTIAGLEIAVGLVKDPAVGELACSTVVAIAKRVIGNAPKETRQALEQVLQAAPPTEITEAARALLPK